MLVCVTRLLALRYVETLDHINGTETSWVLRRDLKAGSSTGRVYQAVDGTVVVR